MAKTYQCPSAAQTGTTKVTNMMQVTPPQSGRKFKRETR